MNSTANPRLLARVAGIFYLVIAALAVFAYVFAGGHLVVAGDMAQTASNIVAHEQLWRMGIAASVIVVLCNLPLGLILYELFKVVNQRVALLALLFITAAAILEAANPLNHMQALLTLTLSDAANAFDESQRQALARVPIRMFGVGFSVALAFFGVFCALIGYLIFRSTFLPRVIGILMIGAGVSYLVETFTGLLAVPSVPYLLAVPLLGEMSLALWLLVFGVDETRWRARASAPGAAP